VNSKDSRNRAIYKGITPGKSKEEKTTMEAPEQVISIESYSRRELMLTEEVFG